MLVNNNKGSSSGNHLNLENTNSTSMVAILVTQARMGLAVLFATIMVIGSWAFMDHVEFHPTQIHNFKLYTTTLMLLGLMEFAI